MSTRGKSVLAVGVLGMRGDFRAGDAVRMLDPNGAEMGRGIARCRAPDAAAMAGNLGHASPRSSLISPCSFTPRKSSSEMVPGPLADSVNPRRPARRPHHTSHRFSAGRTMADPALQSNAAANSGRLDSGPITRKRGGECGFVATRSLSASGR